MSGPLPRRRARAEYTVEKDAPGEPFVIRDVGHGRSVTVTNDVDAVVADLVEAGDLPAGRRLFYYDSEGELDEIVVSDGRFAGFKPGPVGGLSRLRKPSFTPTHTNIYALKCYFAGRAEAPERASAVDAPHLIRCVRAGLIERSRPGYVRLTDAGRAAIAAMPSVPAKEEPR